MFPTKASVFHHLGEDVDSGSGLKLFD